MLGKILWISFNSAGNRNNNNLYWFVEIPKSVLLILKSSSVCFHVIQAFHLKGVFWSRSINFMQFWKANNFSCELLIFIYIIFFGVYIEKQRWSNWTVNIKIYHIIVYNYHQSTWTAHKIYFIGLLKFN